MGAGLVIDRNAHTVTLDHVPLELTPTEYLLLAYLVDRSGLAVADQELLAVIWGDGWLQATAVLQVQISRLRRKLRGNTESWRFISRVRSFGYRFDPEETPDQQAQSWEILLTYDADLILRSVTPHEPFLGWRPDDIIGTTFMLAGIDHTQAHKIVQALLATDNLRMKQAILAQCADGTHVPAEIQVILTTTSTGTLTGMTGQARFLPST